jgi:acetyltransferase-like isoleucine patch superfamily enzyme
VTEKRAETQPLSSLEDAQEFGARFQGGCRLRLGKKIAFQPPVRFDAVDCNAVLYVGSYTFFRQAYLAGVVSVGRYCSIGANFSVGEPNHPMDWMSTSSVQYQKGKFGYFEPMDEFEPASLPDFLGEENRTIIGHDIWIGSNVMVLRGVKVGNGAVIAAGAVVAEDVAPYTIVGGVPARKIRDRFEDPKISEALSAFKWWEFAAPDMSGAPFSDPLKAIEVIAAREQADEIKRTRFERGTIQWRNKELEFLPPTKAASA